MNPALLLILLTAVLPTGDLPRHPHFQRQVDISLRRRGQDALKMSASHLTVTFDRKGFEEMKPGGTWHLANAHIEVSADLKIGGKPVKAGRYRLVARKAKGGKWELVLDAPARFSRKLTEAAVPLETAFTSKHEKKEHLSIDFFPSGEKSNTVIDLVVAFDKHRAKARVEIQ